MHACVRAMTGKSAASAIEAVHAPAQEGGRDEGHPS